MIDNTLFVGKVLHILNEVNSTNTYAAQLITDGNISEGTAIVAHAQPQGRGQRGSGWESEAYKNITTSIILAPNFLAIDKQFYLNMAISLGVADYLSSILKDNMVKIKWPNDIYVNDKKIAGILIENTLKGSLISYAVAGIGLNINQSIFVSDAPNPTSLQLETGTEYSIDNCLAGLYKHIEVRYLQLRANNIEKLKADYLYNLYRIGDWHSFRVNENTILARITGINEQGRLLTEDSLGKENSWDLKEIKFVI